MKGFVAAVSAAVLFSGGFFVDKAEAGNWPAVCDGKPPHYLAGLKQTDDQIEAFNQIQLVYEMSKADSVNDGARWGSNLGEKVDLTFYGHTVTLYLPMYRKAEDGVYHYTASGSTKLTNQEFECVKEDFRDWVQRSIDADFKDHKGINTLAVESFANRNDKTLDEVRELLKKPIPEYNTTYADVLQIPQIEPVDFIKHVKHMYFTQMGSCNAAVYLKSFVILTPCMRRMDHVTGYPSVMKHELIHASTLQGYPIGWYFDMELFAALLPFLEHPANLEDFFYHGYLSTPWEALRVFACFDVGKMRKEIFRYQVPWGGSALNREVLAGYLGEINKASAWIRETGLKVLGEFYSDPHVWVAVNDMSFDDHMAYKVIMAKMYEPTCLGGHSKTVRFILKHADESKNIADSAWKRVGGKSNFNKEQAKAMKDLMRLANALGLSEDDLLRAGRLYGLRGLEPEQLNLEKVRDLLRDFILSRDRFPPGFNFKEVR